MSHTPGPWQVIESDGGYTIANPTIDQQSGTEMYDPVVWEMGGISSEADAHLIAAAPDLLEAIEKVCGTLKQRWGHADAPYDPDMLHAIQVLSIAKARARKTT